MPRVHPNLDFPSQVDASKKWLGLFLQALLRAWNRLAVIINGRISFGDGTDPDNIDGAWVSVTTPGVANTDFTVTHNLNRIPVGYIIMSKNAACDIYTGSVAATATQLTLRGTVINIDVVLFIV